MSLTLLGQAQIRGRSMNLKLAGPGDAAGVLALYDSLRHTDG